MLTEDPPIRQSRGTTPIAEVAQSCHTSFLFFGSSKPMPTTTIRIEDELKARLAAVAKRTGKTPHAFILDAIARTVEQAELDDAFHHLANARWTRIVATGETVPWDDAKTWLEARSRGESPRKPRAIRF